MYEKGLFAGTPKQREILNVILKAADEGTFLTARQLKERLSYGAQVGHTAIYCSLNFLEKHGMITKERGYRGAIVLKPTLKTYQVMRPT